MRPLKVGGGPADPDGSTNDYQYDEDGNLQNYRRVNGSVVHFEYDRQHRLTEVADAAGGMRSPWHTAGTHRPQGYITANHTIRVKLIKYCKLKKYAEKQRKTIC